MPASKATKPSKASLSHFMLAGHALTLGAFSATMEEVERLIAGEGVSGETWTKAFQGSATAHAKSITPVGGLVLERAFAPEVAVN